MRNPYQQGFEDGSNASVGYTYFLDNSEDYHPPEDAGEKELYDKGFKDGRTSLRQKLNEQER